MPTLDWLGKERIVAYYLEVPFHVLDHKYGFDASGMSELLSAGNDGLSGAFDYYEVGLPLFNGEYLNEEVGVDKIREYVYYSETNRPLARQSGGWLMDTCNGTGYYFYYKPEAVTDLNFDTVQEIITERAENYVIYADTCSLSAEFMTRRNIIFKKIPRDIRRF